jgi:prepilin-type N-terminal cleavage/methylation domain-containing protein
MPCCFPLGSNREWKFGRFKPTAGGNARSRAGPRRVSFPGGAVSGRDSRGFSLVELAVVVTIIGIMFAIGVPSYLNYRRTQELRGASSNIASQIRLARATAIMTGRTQRFHLYQGFNGYDYHVHDGTGGIKSGWLLPKGITYSWGSALISVDLDKDGRASAPLDIELLREDGQRDTVFVQKSGMVFMR